MILPMRRLEVAIGLACGAAFGALTLRAVLGGYVPGEQTFLSSIIAHRVVMLNQPALVISALGSMNFILPSWLALMVALSILKRWSAVLQIALVPLCYPLYAAIKTLVGRAGPTSPAFPRLNDLPLGYFLEGFLRQHLQELPPQAEPVPVVPPPVTEQSITQIMETGYVSGHALVALMFYGMLAWLIWKNIPSTPVRWLGTLIFSALALLVGVARVYMGVHFPSDVFGAWLLGVVIVLLLNRLPTFAARVSQDKT
jgi:membrane-associated phospholipid phosphatase